MPGWYKVQYVFRDFRGISMYIYEGHRDDHYGTYENRYYRGATTRADLFNLNYVVGKPYVLDENGFYQASTATTSLWRRLQRPFEGIPSGGAGSRTG